MNDYAGAGAAGGASQGQPQPGPQPPYLPQLPGQFPQPQAWQGPPGQWRQPYPPRPMLVSPKSPALGLVVSFFFPGVGSMIAGKAGKGIGILIGYFIGLVLCFVLIGFIVAPAFWIWGMVAGYSDAVSWNRAHGILS